MQPGEDLLLAAARVAVDDQLNADLVAHGWDRRYVNRRFREAFADLGERAADRFLMGLFLGPAAPRPEFMG